MNSGGYILKVGIIGGMHAGVQAALSIKNTFPEHEVVIFERNKKIAFISASISFMLGTENVDENEVFLSTSEQLKRVGINVLTETEVDKIEFESKKVDYHKVGTKTEKSIQFDRLILAMGSCAISPFIRTEEMMERVFFVKTWQDAQQITENISDFTNIAVIGGGYSGLEIANELAANHKSVDLFDRQKHILEKYYSLDFSERIANQLTKNGIDIYNGYELKDLRYCNDSDKMMVDFSGRPSNRKKYDAVIMAVGTFPNTQLVDDLLDVSDDGAILVDEYLETSVTNVFAAGDVATKSGVVKQGLDNYAPFASSAIRQGTIAGINSIKKQVKFTGSSLTSALHFTDKNFSRTGITEQYAEKKGIKFMKTSLSQKYRVDFLDDNIMIDAELLWSPVDGKILGGAFQSANDVTSLANLVSFAIEKRQTVGDLAFADFLFHPLYNTPENFIVAIAKAAWTEFTQLRG